MKKLAVLLVVLVCVSVIAGVTAEEQRRQTADCEQAGSQFDSNQCAHKEYLAADAELNQAYNKLMATLNKAEERARLKDAELAWLKYRDANCEYEAFFYRGGTIRPMIQAFCLTRMTDARAGELKQQLKLLER